ncbi:hypothetical protein HYZ41_02045 [archaeon]|nr:hypothetical protein [archaeon]
MSVVDFFFFRNTPYRLRKKYDRLRERADRENNINKRLTVLQFLDNIESYLKGIEEGFTPDFQKRKMMKYIGQNLKKAEKMLKDKEYLAPMIRPTQQRKR